MSYKAFINEVSKINEFKHIVITEPDKGENYVVYSGDIIGSENNDYFSAVAKKHGFITFSQELSVWVSEEFFNKYGKGKNKK